jgi:nucleotide-binding universal stress UspA family protein
VVGVDGSDSARQALHWAIREARARDGMVKAVAACRWDDSMVPAGSGRAEERQRAKNMLTREMNALPRDMVAGIPLSLEAAEGRAADVLVTASHDADLLVLGSHGHSRELHCLLGSVADDCVRNAICPVVVLPIRYATHPVPTAADASNEGIRVRPQWTGDPVHPYVLSATY